MFDCNKCEHEETEYCSSCIEAYRPSNWKRKREDIKEIMENSKYVDNTKIK